MYSWGGKREETHASFARTLDTLSRDTRSTYHTAIIETFRVTVAP